MAYRRTLKKNVSCTGIGLHSGKPVRLRLKPAPPESGIRFVRADVGVEIPATLEHLARLDHATTLSRDGASIETVEHLLSALYGLGVDDVVVEVEGPEIPIMDGSAAPFAFLINEAGLKPHAVLRQYLKVLDTVEVVRGARSVRLTPSDHFEVTYTIGFDHPLLRYQSAGFKVTRETFIEEIAQARTFGFLSDVEALRRSGLALGGSLENAIVIGESGVLNNTLRFEDEFVRHKILDAIGDLALLGHPIVGHLKAVKAGHALHAALARKLVESPRAWALVTHPQLPVVGVPPTPGLVLKPS
jgi:UDP-3-O-[3-hydroxymyristoyl] N-acetylglucosamine deacetylase